MMKTLSPTGFATAAGAVTAQTPVLTDSVGLVAGEVAFAVGNAMLPAYRAAPATRLRLV